jgi:hypothetical protein
MASLAAGQDKSSIISALVSQMKAGSISKNDLFEQLSKLHRGGNTGPNADDIQEEETPAPIEQPSAQTPSAEESVRRLVDEKRRERMAAADTNATLDTKQREQITIDELMSQSKSFEPTSTTTHNNNNNNNNNNTRNNQTNQHNRTNGQRGNPNASGGRGYSTPSRTNTGRRSNTSVAKSGRHERREEELRNDAMSECTFQPKITKLPASYGAARSYVKENFHSRVMKWKETREKSLAQRREDNVLEEMDNCTFKPEVNAPGFRSHRAVSTPRGRISQSSERSTTKNVVERLYSTQRKATRTAEAELKRSREEEFKRTCTFQPNVGKRRNGGRAMTPSRYQQEQKKRGGYASARRAPKVQPTGMDECTFQPKVNTVSNKFASARLYLQNNVHDRLSTPRAEPNQEHSPQSSSNSSGVVDMESFIDSLESKKSSGRSNKRPSSARRSRDGENSKNFNEFLARQNARSSRKERNLQNLRKRATPSHKPRICSKSRQIASSTTQGGFMQRLAKDALRKEHGKMKQKAEIARLESCTFKPNILASSRARPARSYTELSRGDSLKRETAARLMKLKAEQDELEGLTFQPKLNPSNARSRLNILNDPDSYLERIQKQEENFSVRRRKALQEQEMKEFAECTFHPQINDAPSYIKRIAKSMALARDARPNSKKNSMPEWK